MRRIFTQNGLILAVLASNLFVNPVNAMKHDGPPLHHVDIRQIGNAIPKVEPLSHYGNMPIYYAKHHYYKTMNSSAGYKKRGIASWYGRLFHAHRTSSGEKYNMYAMTAAHKSLPLPTYVRVKNLENGREIIVKVNDRGPFYQDRIIDLSYVAAKKLDMIKNGTAHVEVTAIDPEEYNHTHNTMHSINTLNEFDEEDDDESAVAETYGNSQHIYLQVGAFNSRENADYQATQIAQVTDMPVQLNTISSQNGVFYRVQIGPLANVEATEKVQQKIQAAGLGEVIPSME